MQAFLELLGISVFRTVLLFLLTLVAVRVSGKRSVAQLAPFDLTIIIMMGSIAALPLEDPEISIWAGIIPIVVLSVLEYVLSALTVRWRGLEKVTQGMSTPVVLNGQVLYDNLKKERVSEADLHIILRQAGAERLEDIALAVLEPTGQCSVIKKKESQPVTLKDMDLMTLTRMDAIREQVAGRGKERLADVIQAVSRRSSSGRKRNMV
ncbi:MAG TPA: DUF421 domain-containing protein [Firmicutes bacterium]|nr:DUF421 domain-containing protein [Candidatus Fermentithermobacillaceae bacterium]